MQFLIQFRRFFFLYCLDIILDLVIIEFLNNFLKHIHFSNNILNKFNMFAVPKTSQNKHPSIYTRMKL